VAQPASDQAESDPGGAGPGPAVGPLATRAWSRMRRLASRVRDLCPLTLPGLLLLGLAALALRHWGMGRLDLVVLAATVLGGGVLLLLAALVVIAALVLSLRLRRLPAGAPLAADCGSPLATGFRFPFPRWLPLLEVGWRWNNPRRVEVVATRDLGGLAEVVTAERRGRAEQVVRRVTVGDVTGLTAVTLTTSSATTVSFAPRCGALARLPLLEGLIAGDDLPDPRGGPFGDPIDMRRYAHGDSPRFILWKVYARSRKLLVRVPERALAVRTRTCAYLVAGPGDEPSAALARASLELGLLGEGWRFGADGSRATASNRDEALDALVASGDADPRGPTGLAPFLDRAARDGYAHCLLFVPPGPGPWLDTVPATVARTALRTVVLTAVDGVAADTPRPAWWRRLFLEADTDGHPVAASLDRMATPFLGLPCRMAAVDRTTGLLLGDPRLRVALAQRGAAR
jgi:hypothetical protein